MRNTIGHHPPVAGRTIIPAKAAIFILLLLVLSIRSFSQSKVDSVLGKLDPQRLADCITKKAGKLEEKLLVKSESVLNKLRKQEEKIYNKMLRGKDSLPAKAEFERIKTQYEEKLNSLKQTGNGLVNKAGPYLPKLDSLSTSLKFLNDAGVGGKVKDALAKTASLKDKFNQAEEIKKFIRERKELLKQQLEKLGMVKQLKQINKQVYYYSAQIKEYKEILSDPKKIEKKALELLSKTKLWKDFFRKNSVLASLFRIPDPDAPLNMADFAGLQTRVQVSGLIQQQIQAGGAGAQQQLRQNLQSAQSQLNELKNKLGKASGSSDDIMPEGFKPNNQKTKSFLQRLELGTNIQTQKASGYFPTTTDLGLSLGYKLNGKSVIGVGASYKMGWGRGWNDITITHQGLGLRSFIDWRLKGSLWISGGYEMNFKSSFQDLTQLRNMNGWQRSGLVGLSRSIPVKSKFFKKTKVQLLWDFLSYEQIPRTQPVLFRIEYNIK